MAEVSFRLKDEAVKLDVSGDRTLLSVLRNEFDRVEVRQGCETGHCGACTVLVDGRPVQSCQIKAASIDGGTVETVADLGRDPIGAILQSAFSDAAASQCGYCISGIVVTLYASLKDGLSRDDALASLGAHRCRCGSQLRILDAFERARGRLTAGAQA
jgi:aerobic-type carbon monoxide dehydrogenase small subunit (CoxS/CutS family)